MRRKVASLVGFVAVHLGCAGDDHADPFTRTERDSAEVRIVEFDAPGSWGAALQLDELLRIGQFEGPEEYLFSTVPGGVLLDDGSFVVADRVASEVRRFSETGAFLGKHGREGQGPGEYEYIRAVGRCSHTGFTVFDLSWQLNEYDSEGSFQETRTLRLEDGSTPYHLACSRSGRFAVTNWDTSAFGVVGVFTAKARLQTLQPDGSREYDLAERIGSERLGTPRGSRPHPFGRSTHVAFDGEDLIVADGSLFGYERWSSAGTFEELVRIERPAPNLDSLATAYVEVAVDRIREDEGTGTQDRIGALREEGELLRGLESAAHLRDMRVLNGQVLVQEQTASPTEGRWFLFADDGTPLGFLELPPSARLLDMSDARILVTEVGDLDVPQVVLYEFNVQGAGRTNR